MKLRAMILTGAILVTAAVPATAGGPKCRDASKQIYARKSELPRGALEATGVIMAEKGARFQATDVVNEPGLPIYRFVRARRDGCTLRIDYEQGGFAHRWGSFVLGQSSGRWKLTGRK